MRLSEAQRERLCEMTNSAYWEIRHLAEAGKLEQAFELSSIFHNLLNDIWNDEFSLPEFRDWLSAGYQLKYADPASQGYVALVDRIIAMGNEDPSGTTPGGENRPGCEAP